MGIKISSLAADLDKEMSGEWVDIPEWPGVRLQVRSINNKNFQNAREQRISKLIKDLGRSPYSSETGPHIAKLAATFLLLGWEGICDDDGKAIDYTPQKAMDLLSDPAMRALTEQVIWAATRVGSKDAEFTVDAAKNSPAPSAGT